VIGEKTTLAVLGVAAGALGGLALAQLLRTYLPDTRLPGVLPVIGAAAMLIVAAVVASVVPASRAARVDVMQALRSE
jgi:putative ABC transport system permease protein